MKLQESGYAFSLLSEQDVRLPFFLVGAGVNHEQEDVERPFGYPHYQWIHVIKGKGILTDRDGKTHFAGENQGFILNPDEAHSYKAVDAPWRVYWLTFGGYHIERLLSTFQLNKTGVYNISHREELDSQVQTALELINSRHGMRALDCSTLVYSFLTDLYRYTSQSDDSPALRHNKINPVLRYMEDHYKELITIDQLAGVLQISPQHLCTLFKQALDTRPFEYLNALRIHQSKYLLKGHPERRINQIAKECGFESNAYFTTMFKKQTGLTPSQFRKLHGRA
ncbi:MAG: AraC family transcriptional regulator [Spirochaetales bacterium]|nr:AraC family transcriptional regulator [Spirochaetales bacterium]